MDDCRINAGGQPGSIAGAERGLTPIQAPDRGHVTAPRSGGGTRPQADSDCEGSKAAGSDVPRSGALERPSPLTGDRAGLAPATLEAQSLALDLVTEIDDCETERQYAIYQLYWWLSLFGFGEDLEPRTVRAAVDRVIDTVIDGLELSLRADGVSEPVVRDLLAWAEVEFRAGSDERRIAVALRGGISPRDFEEEIALACESLRFSPAGELLQIALARGARVTRGERC